MNGNKTVVIDGKIQELNISDLIDITDPKQVKLFLLKQETLLSLLMV